MRDLRDLTKQELEDLNGEVISHIDVDKTSDEILITTESGRQILIYHAQECCEVVGIRSVSPDYTNAVKEIILSLNTTEMQFDSAESDSQTITVVELKTTGCTVVSVWFGESNGYYSESVDIAEIIKTNE